jgi:hypothetical protein
VLRRSLYWRGACLLAALVWACGAICFILWFPVRTGVITMQGVALSRSLYAQTPSIWPLNFTILGATVLGGAVDLAVRVRRRIHGPGALALIAACLLGLWSLLGLIYGVLGFGPIAVFVGLSALPLKFTSAEEPVEPRWYPSSGPRRGPP